MKSIIIAIIAFFPILVKAQCDSVLYVFPDKVEVEISNYIKTYTNANTESQFYIYLETDSSQSYTVKIAPFHKKGNRGCDWVNMSSRYVIINENFYPLLFDYDIIFATTDKRHIGNFGKREGFIKRRYILGEYYKISFNKKGEILKMGEH